MLVQTREQFEGVRTALAGASTVVVDTETTGLQPHYGDRLCGVSTWCEIKNGQHTFALEAYFPFRHKPGESLFNVSENLPQEWLKELLQVLDKPDGLLQFHHAKFDLHMLAYEGFDFHLNPFLCSQVMAWLNLEGESHKLEDLVVKYELDKDALGYKAAMKELVKKSGGTYDKVSPADMEAYACADARNTHLLCDFLIQRLQAQDLWHLVPGEMEFVRRLFEMERAGLGVDLTLCDELSAQAALRMRELEDRIGFDPGKNNELARRLFLAPPVGLGLTPEKLTLTTSVDFPEGIPSLRQEWLAQRKLEHPLIASVMEYKGLVKANSTWFAKFTELTGKAKDGRLHTTFNGSSDTASKNGVRGKSGTVTGRVNSSGPNFQNFPRHTEDAEDGIQRRVKDLFGPNRQRWGLFEFDYAQVEVRLGAGYANATLMLDAIRAGADPHRVTAERIGCSRQTAKHATYTILYGGAADTLANTIERLEFQTTGKVIEYPVADAEEILRAYFDLYPGFRDVQRQASRAIRDRGFVLIWNGRKRHYEQWWSPERNKKVDNGHKAFNSIIQGGAAEIIKRSMISIPRKDFAYRMVSQVHDSLWFEITNDYREGYIEEIKYAMEWPSRDPRFKVPFDVDVKMMKLEPFDERLWADAPI